MTASRPASRPVTASNTTGAGPSPSVMATYARQDIVFDRGEGAWLISTDGERYLDFGSGVAVNALGHAHPALVKALTEQASKLWHTSNLYRIAEQESLAERLCAVSFAEQAFFCNSGAEACEGAIKLARRYQYANGAVERTRIITFEGAFHGRTLAALSAAGNEKYLEGFGPPAEGFDSVPLGNIEAAENAIGAETAAIMIEPIQGEGGINVVPAEHMVKLRNLCDDHGLLLVLDEVQCGMGRTGKLFAHEWAGITPDIVACAKGIGGGFPLGAILATQDVASTMTPGTHGSTFGGNPLAMAVGNAVLDTVLAPGFLDTVNQRALRMRQALAELTDRFPNDIIDVRGAGLMLGLKLRPPAANVVKAATSQKLLVVAAADNVVRLLPPLNVSDDEISSAVERFAGALEDVTKHQY